MKKIFFCIAMVLSGVYISAQSAVDNKIFRNTGRMYIGGTTSGTALYVPDAVVASDSVQIVLKGQWEVGGNFYNESDSSVFVLNHADNTGNMVFGDNHAGVNRLVTATTFNRSKNFVAFPNVVIGTNDTIIIPAQMGIDATTLKRAAVKTGYVLLQSAEEGGKVYDASLRITKNDISSNIVDAGAVIVEKYVKTYRGNELFGFASPFKGTQKASYFAGNWLRRPVENATNNHHTKYVLGDYDSDGDGKIDRNQYVDNPAEALQYAQAYLVKSRPDGFDYDDLITDGGLLVTSLTTAAFYDKEKFVFDGKTDNTYDASPTNELLFADQTLKSFNISTPLSTTTNWLIGNSYTSAISIKKLVDLMATSAYTFFTHLYIFPAGSTTYQSITLDPLGIQTLAIDEIPAMSVFMLRLKTEVKGSTFDITKDLLVHSKVSAGQNGHYAPGRRNAPDNYSNLNNQVIFRLTPIDNENVFDIAAIGLRNGASLASDKYDMAKVYVSDNSGFQLYTLSEPDANTNIASKLTANGVPTNVDSVLMNLKPNMEMQTLVLSVEGVETLSSEDFWVEDLKTGTTHRFFNGEPYIFTTNPDDEQSRFVVHFKVQPVPENQTVIDETLANKLNIYNIGKEIFIENLLPNDIGTDAAIYDVAGKLLDTFKVTEYPKMSYATNGLVSGTYMVRLYRANSAETLKMIIR